MKQEFLEPESLEGTTSQYGGSWRQLKKRKTIIEF